MNHVPCSDCGAAVPYEPIMYGDVDMAALLAHLCDTCANARAEAYKAMQRQKRIKACQAALAACTGERLQETSVDHPDFNRGAWFGDPQKNTPGINNLVDVTSSRSLVLVGPSGLCKSRMMYLLCKRAVWKGYTIEWITTDGLTILAEKLAKFSTREEAREKFEKLKRADRLVIDDIGKTKWTTQTEEGVWIVLAYRYDHNKPTWASCNTHPDHLKLEGWFSRDRGAAIVGRILEDAQVFTLTHHPHP